VALIKKDYEEGRLRPTPAGHPTVVRDCSKSRGNSNLEYLSTVKISIEYVVYDPRGLISEVDEF
jgi:hypothetical protein